MSGGLEWLQKQRKTELLEMASHVGLKGYQKMNKEELVVVIEEHLRTHATKLSKDSELAPFFQEPDPAMSIKHKVSKAQPTNVSEDEKKPKQRRQTIKNKEDLEGAISSATNSLAQTPAARKTLALASNIRLPPSPAVIANKIDAQTTSLRRSVSQSFTSSRIPSYAVQARNFLSNPTTLELVVLGVEAFGLRSQVLPLRYLGEIPPVPVLGLKEPIYLKAPDLFALLTAAFWGPVGLWLWTSILLPCAGGWFINLKGDGGYDPVSYNVVKALVAWIVYIRGGVGGDSVRIVEAGVPGGVVGMLIGAAICTLAGVYHAVLRK